MLTAFRAFSRSKWAAALLVLIAISFVIVGARMDVFSNLGPKHVIDAGDRSMNEAEFRTAFDQVRERLQQQVGRPLMNQELVAENIHVRFLTEQTQQLGFLNWAYKAGIRPGKELIVKQIRQIPAFFNSVTGQFDQQAYEAALAQQNLTPAMLEQDLRDQYATEHFGAAIFAGARVPRIYGALLAGSAFESRDGRWFEVTPAMAGQIPAPTDAQLNAFIQENADRLRAPEFRMVSVVLFTPEASANAPISEDRIRERFEFKKDTLSKPETRSFVTLTAPNRETAQKIAAALHAGHQEPEQQFDEQERDHEAEQREEPVAPHRLVRVAVQGRVVHRGDHVRGARGGEVEVDLLAEVPVVLLVGLTQGEVHALVPVHHAGLRGLVVLQQGHAHVGVHHGAAAL